ncbi:transmembrane emp24 domain-containing protein p24beta2-like [Cucurbita moschata]|uniref:Transmembrane emp24 domain-containing protein p24beta2-like n=2 Tax=Cucurbita TaxID=3660 RepID=A0A6J1GJG3_CUCMO|nr:transmembrane emp24 domain-containing protein p24beta2-like [Cucurbita moschata]
MAALFISSHPVLGIRFVIDKEECFSHNVEFIRDTIYLSFVVVSVHTWRHHAHNGVDLLVKGPLGERIEEIRGKTSEKFEFISLRKGRYHFCFINNSPHQETIEFDIHINHYYEFYDDDEQHVKDEHLSPLLAQIKKLGETLGVIEFEQQWLEAQTERQAKVNEAMSTMAILKAVLESAALIGASSLQVFLLRRLFEKKVGSLYSSTYRI